MAGELFAEKPYKNGPVSWSHLMFAKHAIEAVGTEVRKTSSDCNNDGKIIIRV